MKPGAKISIVTPGALGSNPRVVKEAQALSDAGYEVSVIATRTLEIVDARDDHILAGAKWKVRRLDFRPSHLRRFRRAVQLGAASLFDLTGSSAFAEWGFSVYARALAAAAKRERADLYIAHYPAALPGTASAARCNGAVYAFDAEDFHLGDYPETPAYRRERAMIREIEGRYLPGCVYVSAASPGIAETYARTYGIARPTVLLNVFPRAQGPQAPTLSGSEVPGPTVYWFSQTIGPDRGLECAARAIGLARSRPHLYLRGTLAAGFLEHLRAVANDAGAADRLHILNPAAPSEMERLTAAYDLGFVGETGHTESRRIALTNKLFSYLLAGIPAVLSDVPAHRKFAGEATDAVSLYESDNPQSLAAVLDRLLSNPDSLAKARAAAFDLGRKRFNWEVEKRLLLELVDGIGSSKAQSSPVSRHALAESGIARP